MARDEEQREDLRVTEKETASNDLRKVTGRKVNERGWLPGGVLEMR